MRLAKAHARRHHLTLGQAVSDLVRLGAERPLATTERNGLRVVRLGRGSPKVTADAVNALLETTRREDGAARSQRPHGAPLAGAWNITTPRTAGSVAAGRRHGDSTPLTQLGVVRLVSNPAFSRDALSPAGAVALLAQNLATAAHRFWSDGLQVPTALRAVETALQGHQQFVDVYLLALAARHRAGYSPRSIAAYGGSSPTPRPSKSSRPDSGGLLTSGRAP